MRLWNTIETVLKSNFCIGHMITDVGVIWNGIARWVCIPNLKFLSVTVTKLLWRLLKLTTDRHRAWKQTEHRMYTFYSPGRHPLQARLGIFQVTVISLTQCHSASSSKSFAGMKPSCYFQIIRSMINVCAVLPCTSTSNGKQKNKI